MGLALGPQLPPLDVIRTQGMLVQGLWLAAANILNTIVLPPAIDDAGGAGSKNYDYSQVRSAYIFCSALQKLACCAQIHHRPNYAREDRIVVAISLLLCDLLCPRAPLDPFLARRRFPQQQLIGSMLC